MFASWREVRPKIEDCAFVGLPHLWPMNIKTFTFNPFLENAYVIYDQEKQGVIIDPGCYEDHEIAQLVDFVGSESINIIAIINTHCHIDHILGNDQLKDHFQVKLWAPQNEKEVYRAVPSYAPSYGFAHYREAEVDVWFEEGNTTFGGLVFQVIEVPGHSPGHMVFYFEEEKTLIGGDVLFRESIGRTDLPGGNHDQLLTNIKEKVYTLPEDVTVFPGHGPETTIGHEKAYNPFVRG